MSARSSSRASKPPVRVTTDEPSASHALELRRRGAAVGDRDAKAAALQVARHGQARAAHADDHGVRRGLCGLRAHRSFSVARPASTRMKLMIQKRTITFGSAQPLSSK